jgi:hypothetical protein
VAWETVYSTTVDIGAGTALASSSTVVDMPYSTPRREVTPMTVTAIQIGLDPDDIRRWYPNPAAVA